MAVVNIKCRHSQCVTCYFCVYGIHVYVRMYVYIYVCVCVVGRNCVYGFIYMYIHTYVCMYIYMYVFSSWQVVGFYLYHVCTYVYTYYSVCTQFNVVL